MTTLVFNTLDFTIDWFSGRGAGGQHRNKHQNCCRITHKATGIVAVGQESRSRRANMARAYETMRSRLLEHYTPEQQRRAVGERVRTYHEPRNEVIDHASGVRATYRDVVINGDIGGMITARKMAT